MFWKRLKYSQVFMKENNPFFLKIKEHNNTSIKIYVKKIKYQSNLIKKTIRLNAIPTEKLIFFFNKGSNSYKIKKICRKIN